MPPPTMSAQAPPPCDAETEPIPEDKAIVVGVPAAADVSGVPRNPPPPPPPPPPWWWWWWGGGWMLLVVSASAWLTAAVVVVGRGDVEAEVEAATAAAREAKMSVASCCWGLVRLRLRLIRRDGRRWWWWWWTWLWKLSSSSESAALGLSCGGRWGQGGLIDWI
jgi:hypothetical protein